MTLPWTVICVRKCFAFVECTHLDDIFLSLFHFSVGIFYLNTSTALFLLLEVKNILIFYIIGILVAQGEGKY